MAAAMRAHNVLCNSYYNTPPAVRAHNVLCNSYNTPAAMRAHNVLCNSYNRITVEMNLCSYRSVRFALLYIVGGSISFRPDIQRPRQMQNALRDI
jgi:hypothetical protein